MSRTYFLLLCLCGALLVPAQARAQSPSLTTLTVGGAAGTGSGLVGGAAFAASLGLIARKSAPSNEYAAIGPTLFGGLLGAVALPFWTAGGVKLAAKSEGYDVSYRRACAGSLLGLLSYTVFMSPMLLGQRAATVSKWSLSIGALATLFVSMPLLSALMARRHSDSDSDRVEPARGALMLSFGGRL
jgi:hypothetical protein